MDSGGGKGRRKENKDRVNHDFAVMLLLSIFSFWDVSYRGVFTSPLIFFRLDLAAWGNQH